MVDVNVKRLCRNVRMMLDSANAHMLAVGPIKHLNSYLYASMARGAIESILDNIEEDDPAYEQLVALDTEAIAVCERFEAGYKVFNVTTETGKELTIATPEVQPDEKPRKLIQNKPSGNGDYRTLHHDRSHRLAGHERQAIWDYFNVELRGRKPKRGEILEAAQVYNCSVWTIHYWIKNNPSADMQS